MADATDMIGRRPLVDHHMYMPKVIVSMQQPRVLMKSGGSLEAWSAESSGRSQHSDHCRGTLWVKHSYAAAHRHGFLPSASSLPSR
jgi:hypothetical protein